MGEYIKPMLLVILSSEAENTMGKDMFVCTSAVSSQRAHFEKSINEKTR